MQLPDDVWSLILTELCYAVDTTADLLLCRLVCKRWASLIASDHVAYHAVLAANRNVLRSNRGKHPRLADLPISWWSFLLDQVRLDRTWMAGAPLPKLDPAHFINTQWEPQVRADPYSLLRHTRNESKEDLVVPGYEAVLLTHVPTDKEGDGDDALLYYDWTVVDVVVQDTPKKAHHPKAETGAIGFLAFRVHPRLGRFIVVHVNEYPSLTPLATHTVRHKWLGSTETQLDLPLNAPDGRPLAFDETLDPPEFLTVALCHVDHRRKKYLLSFTDFNDHSVLVLRSFAGLDSVTRGQTLASFSYVGRSTTTIVRQGDDPNHYRVLIVDPSTLHTNIYTLAADTLTPTSPPAVLTDEAYLCDYFPHLHRGLTVVANGIGDISLWDAQANTLKEWFPSTPDGRPVRVPLLRPFLRPHLLAEQPKVRPNAPTALHEQREWVQMLVGYVDTPLDFEELEPLRGCKMALVTLPREPNTSLADLVSDNRSARPEIDVGYLNTFLGPSFMAGEILGHLLFVLQYDGTVVAIDLRETNCVAGKRRKLFDLHPRAMQRWVEGKQATGGPDPGQGPTKGQQLSSPYVFHTHRVTGEQARQAPNDLLLPEWASTVVNGMGEAGIASGTGVAPLLQSLLGNPTEVFPALAVSAHELGAPGVPTDLATLNNLMGEEHEQGNGNAVDSDSGEEGWASDHDQGWVSDEDDAEYVPHLPAMFQGLTAEQQHDLFLDDQLDAMMPSEEDMNLSCAGDIMLLGERGSALLVHYGKSIVVLRRRREMAG